MKNLTVPRAALAVPREEFKHLRRAFNRLGLESLHAATPEEVIAVAAQSETMIVVLSGFSPQELERTIRSIRSQPDSAQVLLGCVLETETPGFLYQVGANVVVPPPLTLAACYRLIDRLARRYKTSDLLPALPPEGTETPQEILKRFIKNHQGRHKIYLGAAPGVGKTYAMLSQAHELSGRGADLAVGLIETHGRPETAVLLEGLEIVPRKEIAYKGTLQTEMDLDGILLRHPSAVLVDELAHTNIPGSLNAKRYEDAQILRLAGIDVISTVNVQHIESLNTVIERLTGIKVRETVPDWVIEEADELVLVDISPEALQQRLREGKIYAPEKVPQSLANFFTIHNLTALRELVLRELASKVDERLEEVRAISGKEHLTTGIKDRILACITPTPYAQRLIRRGARLAARLDAELIVLYIETRPFSAKERRELSQNLALAESLESKIVKLQDPDVGTAIARFANEHHITIILLGETRHSRVHAFLHKPILDTILEETRNIDVVIVATHEG